MNKRGFTLIELLAVIVILAIIALIATPIVLNIISDSKESAKIRGAEFYIDAIEYTFANSIVDNNPMGDGIYDILENGNLCLEYDENEQCLNERIIKLDGEKPNSGYVIIEKGKIIESRIAYEGSSVLNIEDQESFISEYEIGDVVAYNAGDGERSWNVISETKDTLTLMLSENFKDSNGNEINWISESDYNEYNRDNTTNSTNSTAYVDEGPITAFKYLNSLSIGIDANTIKDFTYINNTLLNQKNYQKIEIKDGITTITDSGGVEEILSNQAKVRLMTVEELIKIAQIQNPYYRNINFEYLVGYYLKQQGNTTSVKDYIDEKVKFVKEAGLLNNSLYIFAVVSEILFIENNSNLVILPDWLSTEIPSSYYDSYGFYLLSSVYTTGPFVFTVVSLEESNATIFHLDEANDTSTGIRPVIEINKDKLK